MLTVAWIAVAVFPLSEIALALFKRSSPSSSSVRDRGSMQLIWIAIVTSVSAAIFLQSIHVTRMHLAPGLRLGLVVALIGAGLAIRWTAILTLGRLFTVDVAVQQDHALVQTGLYRFVRHPSYSGLLLALTGLGMFFASWLGLVVVVIAPALAVVHRIAVEEDALIQAFGPAYAAYRSRTKRLLPAVF